MTAMFVAIGLLAFCAFYVFMFLTRPKRPPRPWYDVPKPRKPWPKD